MSVMICSGGGGASASPLTTLSPSASHPRTLTRSPLPSPSPPPSHSPCTPLPLPPLSHSRAPPGSRAGGRHKLPRRHPACPQAMRALMRRLPARGREGRSPWSCTYAGEVCGRRDEGGHEVVREAAVAVVVVVVGWGVEVWVGGGGAPVAALHRALDAPVRVIVPAHVRRW